MSEEKRPVRRKGMHAAPSRPYSRGRHIDSLDGMRALAIGSVVAYHLGLPWLPSGHMGVVMFLTLAGYLMTCSVVRGFQRSGFGCLRPFWLRRLKRLWPSLVVMLVLVACLCIAFSQILLTKMRPDIVPSLLGFLNWYYIAQGFSYFDQIGAPSPLTHLWYIGVDVQICIVWPLTLGFLLRRGVRAATMRRVCAGLAVASAVLMAVLYDPSSDPSRVYYGTDTRSFAVLVGAWLGLALPLGAAPTIPVDPERLDRRVAGVVGSASLAGLLAVMVLVPSSSAFFYYGGMLLVSVLTAMLMGTLFVARSLMDRLFSLRGLIWVGTRSYALYLWHYPIIQLLGADGAAPWWIKLVAVALSLAAAEVSWRLVERPVADGRFGAVLGSLFAPCRAVRPRGTRYAAYPAGSHRTRRHAFAVPDRAGVPQPTRRDCVQVLGTAMACGVAAVGAAVGCAVIPDKTLVPREAIKSTGEAVDRGVDFTHMRRVPILREPTVEEAVLEGRLPPSALPVELPEGHFAVRASAADLNAGLLNPVLIGDSVPGDTDFYRVFPDGYIDSYIGRRPDQALAVAQDYLSQGVVGNVLVVAAFSNTTPLPEDLDQMIADAGPDRQVYLVGTVNPDGFQDEANRNLVDCAGRFENAHYVDWPSVCAGWEDVYLYPDGTHLTPDGGPVYLDMIARTIARDVVAGGGAIEPF